MKKYPTTFTFIWVCLFGWMTDYFVAGGDGSVGTKNLRSVKDFMATPMCDRINPEKLPEECTCDDSNGHLSLVIACTKPFNNTYLNDTIGVKLGVDPCDMYGASISFNVTEEKHHIDYRVSGVRAGEQSEIPIPGLSIIVPPLGNAGLDMAVSISGNVDELTLRVGLDACVVVHDRNICASAIPGLRNVLPWWILSGTYSFGDLCNATAVSTKTM